MQVETIASRLRKFREEERLSTRAFAARVRKAGYAVSHPTVASYEREDGTEKVPGAYIAAVCRAFDADPSYFLLMSDEPRPPGRDEAQTKMRLIRAILETRITEPAEGGREWVEEVLESYDHQPPPAAPPRRAGGGGGPT